MKRACCLLLGVIGFGCGHPEPRFPLRAPLSRDTDLKPVFVACRPDPKPGDPAHVNCAPRTYQSSLYWDGADNVFFRPLSEVFGVSVGHEAINVNSLDEVADSAWFENRIGIHRLSAEDIRTAGCKREQMLDPASAPDGSWVVDGGKLEGSSRGFQMKVPGKGRYFVKVEDSSDPERQSGAALIGMAAFHAAGYFTPCEQIVYAKKSTFKLLPNLRSKANFKDEVPFDQAAFDRLFAKATRHGELVRLNASAKIPGHLLGPSLYKGTREDDPNDVIPHEDRRETRGMRVLAAWLNRWDAREENSLDTWFTDGKGAKDASPGHVIHYQLDTNECIGGLGDWDTVSKRLGSAYLVDWGEAGADFVTLGIRKRPWDVAEKAPGYELFGYFDVETFDPDGWKAEYQIASFSRMTEHDGAWMARILARFLPEHIRTMAELGDFANPSHTDHLQRVLEGRLRKILERYLLRLSPLADLAVEGSSYLCGVDLAEYRNVRDNRRFVHSAVTSRGAHLAISRPGGARVCAPLPHFAPDGGPAPGAAERYFTVTFRDAVAAGALVAHLYDLGPSRGFQLAGIERPEP